MVFVKGIRDVLEEDQPEHHMLVLGRVHVIPQLVCGEPQFGFKAEVGCGVRFCHFGCLLWHARLFLRCLRCLPDPQREVQKNVRMLKPVPPRADHAPRLVPGNVAVVVHVLMASLFHPVAPAQTAADRQQALQIHRGQPPPTPGGHGPSPQHIRKRVKNTATGKRSMG